MECKEHRFVFAHVSNTSWLTMQDMDPVTKTIVDSNPLKLRTMVECSECKVRGLGAFILQEDKGDNVFIPMSDKQFVEVSNHPTGG